MQLPDLYINRENELAVKLFLLTCGVVASSVLLIPTISAIWHYKAGKLAMRGASHGEDGRFLFRKKSPVEYWVYFFSFIIIIPLGVAAMMGWLIVMLFFKR